MKKLVILMLASVVVWSCDEPVRLDVTQGESQTIIEGQVTNQSGGQYVKISRSNGFYESGKTPRVTDASVIVKDDTGNEFPFVHNPRNYADSAGYYLPENAFVGEIGRTYFLTVTVGDQVYEAEDELFRVTPIDSLAF